MKSQTALAIVLAFLPHAALSRPLNNGSGCAIQTQWQSQGIGKRILTLPGSIAGKKIAISIDTGTNRSLIDEKLVPRSKLKDAAEETTTAFGGNIAIRRVSGLGISVAESKLKVNTAEATDLSKLSIGGDRIDFVIGRDILSRCVVEIDSDSNRIRIGNALKAGKSYTKIPIILHGPNLVPLISVNINQETSILAEVDTGNQSSFVIDSNSWRAIGRSSFRETSAISVGLGGFIVEGLSFVPTIGIGDLIVRDVEIRIEPVSPARTTPALGIAVVGLNLISRFNAVIDLRNKVLWLSPRKTPVAPTEKSTSGIIAVADGDHLRILHVMKNSPAEMIGLKAQDEICRIDGQVIPRDYANSPIRMWSRDKPSRIVQLALCDGRQKQLTLKDFY